MISFQDLSIKRKLMWLSMLASGSALLLACGAFLGYDFVTFRSALAKGLSTQAEIIGLNSASAILFQDAASAEKTLSALKARPGITRAGIYTPQGLLFAQWRRDEKDAFVFPPLPGDPGETVRFRGDDLSLFHPVLFDGAVTEIVYIQSDLESLHSRAKHFLAITAIVLFLALLGSMLVSMGLGLRISRPILELARTADAISTNKNYSVRAAGGGRDEVGVLVGTFNGMLEQIERHGEALQKSHDELERRVEERTRELEASNKELEAFSYSVSHDLRAPLRSIDGFSQALMEDGAGKLDEEGMDSLRRVRGAAQRMAELIDDMLSLSRLTRQEMRRQNVDLSALARAVLEELRRSEPGRTVETVVAEGLTVQGDKELLRAVLENLLGNAWKFSSKKSTARVELGRAPTEGRPFFVKDNGAGFSMDYAHKLFGVFQRLHAMEDFPGTGVGLATVQRIVRRHGGRVWAESRPGEGATFFFTLE